MFPSSPAGSTAIRTGASTGLDFDVATVRAAVAVAGRAPSIHNTQPWRWQFGPAGLLLMADRARQLGVADPDGHSLYVSCGAALHLMNVALRAVGWQVEVHRFPETRNADVLASITPIGRTQPDPDISAQVEAALRRFSDRRPFSTVDVAEEVVEALRVAASGEGAHADFPARADQRLDLAVAVGWADRVERHDENYIAELNRWMRDPDVHSQDGVPADAVAHVSPGHPRHTDVPLRDFEVGVTGRQLIADADEHSLIAVILTPGDFPVDQLASGEAMMRLMIQAERLGLACCPLSQAVDLVAFRARVKTLMGWQREPQMMLRIGYPAQPAALLSRTPRRATSDVLDVLPS